jgi:HD-GYP domain-containing protein (c-di-GMP phosphodiesterase class II)
VSIRPYKKSFTHEEAMKIISEGSGIHFDPLVVEAFVEVSDQIHTESKRVSPLKPKRFIGTQGIFIDELAIL